MAQFDSHGAVVLRFFKPRVGAIRCAGIWPVDEAVEDFVVAVVDYCGVISAITEVIEYVFGRDFNGEFPSFYEAVKAGWEFGGEEVPGLAVILDVLVVECLCTFKDFEVICVSRGCCFDRFGGDRWFGGKDCSGILESCFVLVGVQH